MNRRSWATALWLAAGQLLRRRDPQEARRYLVVQWRAGGRARQARRYRRHFQREHRAGRLIRVRACDPACQQGHTYHTHKG